MGKPFLTVLILPFLLLMHQPVSAQEVRSSLPSDLGRAYGYYTGQKFSIERIKQLYPALAGEAAKAQARFDVVFKASYDNIGKELKAGLGPRWDAYEKQLSDQLTTSLASLDQAAAENFIREVGLRAKGQIESPVLETLLTYNPEFQNDPAKEFLSGFTQIYRTKDHPKAKGVDFQIQYPRSWRAKEGLRPNVIQLITSQNGRGFENTALMVKDIDLPRGYVVTEEELDDFFSPEEMRDMVPEEATFISAKPVVIDRHKGGMIVWEQIAQRVDRKVYTRNVQFVTLYKNKMLFLQCMVGSVSDDPASLRATFEKYEPLFKLIANSFVIQDQY